MTAIYPIDYPFHVNAEGWPEPVYAPPYPFEYYYDNGRDPPGTQSASDVNFRRPLVIRRHTPGSTDPNLPQASARSLSPTINTHLNAKKKFFQSNHDRSRSVANHSSASTDPDERPIKPMRNTSVYNPTFSQKKTFQPRKLPPVRPKPIEPSPRYERSDSFRASSSRASIGYALGRRPVRFDLIPNTPFGIPPKPNNPPRRTVVEEYDEHPVTYRKPIPKKILSYHKVSGMTTREFENYQMSKPRRVVRVRSPPVERIFYRT